MAGLDNQGNQVTTADEADPDFNRPGVNSGQLPFVEQYQFAFKF